MKGIRWVVLTIIVFASFVAYVLRINLSIVSEAMMHDLGMSEYQLGLVFSSFAAGYAIFQFPGGIFGDKFGPRFTISAIAVMWSALTIIIAVIPGKDVLSVSAIVIILMVLRFLVGMFQAPIYPVAIGGSIASWFPVRQWGVCNGLTSTGLTLGAAATAPVLVWLMGTFGWRSALLITAPVGFLVAVLYRWYVSDDPQDHAKITAEELALIASDRPPGKDVPDEGAWKRVLKNRNILLITCSYFCMNYVFYLFFSWFFFYLVDVKGLSATDAGVLTAAQWVLGAIGATVGGLLADFLVRRVGLGRGPRRMVMTALSLSAVFLYAGAMAQNPLVSVVLLCIAFACTQLSEASFWIATMAVAGRHAPMATGILNTGGNLPGVLGGMLVPVTAGLFGWSVAMATGSVFAIVGALMWLLIRADEPISV